jgi:hypothetical protein
VTGTCRGSNVISWFPLRRMDVCLWVPPNPVLTAGPQAVHVSTAAGSTATGSDRSPRSTGLAIRAGAPAVNTKLPHPRFRVPLIGDLVFVDVAKTCHRLVKEIERK